MSAQKGLAVALARIPGVDAREPGIDPGARPVWANARKQKRLPCAEEQGLRRDDNWFTRWFSLV